MSVKVTREQLIKKKEQLLKSLDEVTKSLNRFDEIVYKGKFEKAIQLLKEVSCYLTYPTINVECEECGCSIEVDLDIIIDELKNLCRMEFKNND